ncbi:MAG: OmpA family protein [bacterium]|nr:OmpA family protein [bacterium]
MRARLPLPVLALLFLFTLSAATPAAAQFGKLKDKVKSKVERKVDEKTDQAIDKTIDGAVDGTGKDGEAPAPAEPVAPAAPEAGGDKAAAAAPGGTAVAEDMTLYTKYDFVPGDKVIFYDDLSREELGEFPSRWNLDHGVFEIAKAEGRNWILCTDKGIISPKVARGPLPEKYTVEMEFFSNADHDGWYTIHWVDAAGQRVGELRLGYSYMTRVVINDKELASKEVPKLPRGRHVLRIMATKSTIKCYVDQERIANVPKVADFAPVGFLIEMDPYFENTGISRIGTFRYAEGGKSLREQLDESGRIVTHGILFDSGSDRIKAESFKTLTDIGTMLAEDASLRLSIEGHTDADGADDANLKLSQARAAAVRGYLGEKHGIDGGRLETKGLGEGKPIDTNDTPEGKANNRRVELVKL